MQGPGPGAAAAPGMQQQQQQQQPGPVPAPSTPPGPMPALPAASAASAASVSGRSMPNPSAPAPAVSATGAPAAAPQTGPLGLAVDAQEAIARSQKRQHEFLDQDCKRVCRTDYTQPFTSLQNALERLLPYHILGALNDEEADVEDTPDNAGRDLACSRRQARADVSLRQAVDAARTVERVQRAVAEAVAAHTNAWRRGSGEDRLVMARLLADDARARAAKAAANPGRPLDAYAALSDDEDQQARPRAAQDRQPGAAAAALLGSAHHAAGVLGLGPAAGPAAGAAATGLGGLGALGGGLPLGIGGGLPLGALSLGGVAGGVKQEPHIGATAGLGAAGAFGPAAAAGKVKAEGGVAGGAAGPGGTGALVTQQQQQQQQQQATQHPLGGAAAAEGLKQESKADVKPSGQQQQQQQPQQPSNALGGFGGLGDFNAFVDDGLEEYVEED